jgi:NAD(P)-dependent dehydrogenase (short-subunit alcohol dehydrogenase family)
MNIYQIVQPGRSAAVLARASRWTAADVPDQSGRTAVVTGASSGLGLATASVLASRGATVILAGRDLARAGRAAGRIRAVAPGAGVHVLRLDLASLASVREAAAGIRAAWPRLDLLINNAGVMRPPYQRSADGFELTFATNHLGHFALTGLVLPSLLATPGSRIVTVSSVGHRDGVMRFGDLQSERGYRADDAYAQSKLANLLFTYELAGRLQAAGHAAIALAAHPGLARTGLFRWDPWLTRALLSPALRPLTFWGLHNAQAGALATLRAAADPSARTGEYYGPGGWHEYTGSPVRVESAAQSHDPASQRRLWQMSEQLTGVSYLDVPYPEDHAGTGQGRPLPPR